MLLPYRKDFPTPDDGPVTASLYYNGVLYLGGFFRNVQGQPRHGLAAFDPVTYQLLPWDPDMFIGFGTVEVLYEVGGKIFVGGTNLTSVNGGAHAVTSLFACDPVTGAFDTTIGAPVCNANVLDMVSDGTSLFFVGGFTTVNAVNRQGAAAIDLATGTLTAWDPSLGGVGNCIDYYPPTNKVFIGGSFTSINVSTVPIASLFGADFDTALGVYQGWNPNTNAPITALDIDLSSNLVYIGGHFSTMAGLSRIRVGALPPFPLTVHTPIPAFAPSSVSNINFFRFFNGQIFMGNLGGPLGYGAGATSNFQAQGFAILFPDGTVDNTQRYDVNGPVLDMAYFGAMSGSTPVTLYLCGFFGEFLGYQFQHALAKYTKGGQWVSSWTPFLPNEGDSVDKVHADDLNRILYVLGPFTAITGTNGTFARAGVAAIDIDTGDILPWAPDLGVPSGITHGDILVHNNVIYIVSQFTQATGVNGTFTRNNAAAFDMAGNVLPWDPNLTLGSPAYGTSLSTDGTYMYVGGTFNQVNGAVTRRALARFDLVNGTVDAGWDTQIVDNFNPVLINVRDLAIDLDTGKLYVAGRFTDVGAASGKGGLARIDLATALDDGWAVTPGISVQEPEINAIFKKDGVIRFFGNFETINAQPIDRIGVVDDAGNILTGNYDPGGVAQEMASFSDVWIIGFSSLFFGLPGTPRTQGFSTFDYGNNLHVVPTGLDNEAQTISASDDTYLFVGGSFFRTASVQIPNSGGNALFQLGVVGIPRKPVVDYLLRKFDTTVFRWNPVTEDVNGRFIEPTAYNVYRSNNENLETFDLIYTVSTYDIRGVLDTLFSEDIEGFYAYGVTALNGQGESDMATAEAVRSVMDADLFG